VHGAQSQWYFTYSACFLDLSGADLTDADFYTYDALETTIFGSFDKVDFTRANLRAASDRPVWLNGSTTGAIWTDAICPDGTEAASHGQTCEGHLLPSGEIED
jgi:uncharacterized protein YjbI with pentapeptide repeats